MDQLITVLRAAGEPNRLRILALCAAGDLTVSEITRILGQSQPGVSRHLKLLCDAGLLERYQEGSWAFFHLPTGGENARIARFLVDQIEDDDTYVSRDRSRFADIRQERAMRSDQYFRENAARWDRVRALHVDEAEVEQTLLNMLGTTLVEALLDIGTGTGRMLQVLSSRAREAIGVDQRTALNVSMCWHTLDGDEVCDMTPAPETIIYRPVAGFVADCTEYGADAWLRVSYLLTSDQTF